MRVCPIATKAELADPILRRDARLEAEDRTAAEATPEAAE